MKERYYILLGYLYDFREWLRRRFGRPPYLDVTPLIEEEPKEESHKPVLWIN